MSWLVRGANGGNGVSNTSFSVPLPAGWQQFDLLVMVAALANSGTPTITTPSGWTLIDSQAASSPRAYFLYKIAGATESNPTWLVSVSGGSYAASIVAIGGVNTSTPLDTHGTNRTSSTSTSQVTPSITPSQNNSLIVAAIANASSSLPFGTVTTTSPFTQQDSQATSPGLGTDEAIATDVQVTAASIGATFTTNSAVASLFTAAFKPLPVTPAVLGSVTANGVSSATIALRSPHLFVVTVNGVSSATAIVSTPVRLGAVTANGVSTATIDLKVPQVTKRDGQRAGALLDPSVTLQLHSPMPGARKLISQRFSTNQTGLVITTSVERGFESCTIGFPIRDGDVMRTAWLPMPVLEYQDYGHATVADGVSTLFVGRTAQQPQFIGGNIRAVIASGYWDALNDGYYESSDATLTTTGVVIQSIILQLTPYVTLDLNNWNDPNIQHAPNEFDGQRGGSAIDSMLKEGSGDGSLYDLQFWSDQNDRIIARLMSRVPPLVPDYEVPWYPDSNVVSIAYDPSQIYSHVRASYTTPGGVATVTAWQPDLSDTTFLDANGYQRRLEINAGQKTQVGAEQLRDTTQALQSVPQWGGTIRVSSQYPMFYRGGNVPVIRRSVVSGQWVGVRRLDVLLQIQKSGWNATTDSLTLDVTQGMTRRSLQQKIVETVAAVRTGRNPVTGAPA